MELQEMILVSERRSSGEQNYLSSFEDHLATLERIYPDSRKERSIAIQGLYREKGTSEWREEYADRKEVYRVKFCQDEAELQKFLRWELMGQDPEEPTNRFLEERCSRECLKVLKEHGLDQKGNQLPDAFRYEEKKHTYRRREKIRDFKGREFRVMERVGWKDYLLMNEASGEFLVAFGLEYKVKIPKMSNHSFESEAEGVEWKSSRNLGKQVLQVDFEQVRKEFADELRTYQWKYPSRNVQETLKATGPKL